VKVGTHLNLPDNGTTKREGRDNVEEVGPHEDDVGSLDGDRGSRGKSNADRGSDERRGIVDAIADLRKRE
jgi:hypothetical protein